MFDVSDKVKAIILLSVQLVAAGILGFAQIFGWSLDLWTPITVMIVIMLDTFLGITWVVPKK